MGNHSPLGRPRKPHPHQNAHNGSMTRSTLSRTSRAPIPEPPRDEPDPKPAPRASPVPVHTSGVLGQVLEHEPGPGGEPEPEPGPPRPNPLPALAPVATRPQVGARTSRAAEMSHPRDTFEQASKSPRSFGGT